MTEQPPSRRRGVYAVHDDEIARLLRLPDGQRVVSVSTRWDTLSVMIMVEGEGLPEVLPGCEAPLLNGWNTFAPRSLDVSQMTPGAAHTAVLTQLDAVRFEDPAGRNGRRRILARHAPDHDNECCSCRTVDGNEWGYLAWPCVDYLDAVGDLVYGLPGQDRYLADLVGDALCAMLTDLPGVPDDTAQNAVAAARALLAAPSTGDAIDALALDDPPPAGNTLAEPRPRRRRPPAGRPDTDQPTT